MIFDCKHIAGKIVQKNKNKCYIREKPIINFKWSVRCSFSKIKLYLNSVGIFGDSPFIYPVYGLGGIPEGFSRMCAVHGGTFMLNTDIDGIVFENDHSTSSYFKPGTNDKHVFREKLVTFI